MISRLSRIILAFWLFLIRALISVVAYLFTIVIFDLAQVFLLFFQEDSANSIYQGIRDSVLAICLVAIGFAMLKSRVLVFSEKLS